MGHVTVRSGAVDLDEPTFIEGLPGIGLVGKIATDHVVESLGMSHYGNVRCPGLPRVASYKADDRTLRPPVRLYVDEGRDLLALQSDVPVSPEVVADFADCLTKWLREESATPVYSSGLAGDLPDDGERRIYGIATGDGGRLLGEQDVPPPTEDGVWSGPTGALLDAARETDLTALGLIVDSDPQFPDPEAACVLIERAIEPIAGVDVDVGALRERAAEIREQKQVFAQHMNDAAAESSRVEPMRMFQ